jgi:acyl-coenzyme A synthetase/AMP-(fatty) acid ligase
MTAIDTETTVQTHLPDMPAEVEREMEVFVLMRVNTYGKTEHADKMIASIRKEMTLQFGSTKHPIPVVQVQPTDDQREAIHREVIRQRT